MRFSVIIGAIALAVVVHARTLVAQDSTARVDSVFSRSRPGTPGCAVGVSRHGRTVLTRAYGMANLEYDVRNTPETIFEAGSVAKQFTAAAILLLAQQGKLSLDDQVRKHIPELPDYGAPLTIRHMIHHTSGLRDWGTIAMVEGWPRGSRAHTHDHVLEIVRRQRAINFRPGSEYLYSNTGYNLLAIIVERVSGRSFADFTRTEIFEPLGMARTQWRDDYTRVVKGRATAYASTRNGFRLDMPFENVHGNGGLLTTVEDLLRWSANFDLPRVGGPALVREQLRQARLTGGREIEYAAGLRVTRYRGVPEVGHSGSTAGYRAFLTRYPDQGLAVAVLCNRADAQASELAHRVADVFLGSVAASPPPPKAVTLAPTILAARAGLFRNAVTGAPLRLRVKEGKLVDENDDEAVPLSATVFQNAAGGRAVFEVESDGRTSALRLIQDDGDTLLYLPVEPSAPNGAELSQLTGTYVSDEAGATVTVVQENGKLFLRQRPTRSFELRPAYRDVFELPTGDVARFMRDESGRVTEMSLFLGRVRDLRFRRL
jgi:CubicO group peptidase (beta-lactamase class C family)